MSCNDLPIEDLVAHVDGELTADERERVAGHIAACAVCAREADHLGRSGALLARLPGHDPGPDFARRVGAAAAHPRRGALLRLWPAAAAAAAVLVVAIALRGRVGAPGERERVLAARDEREIAADLYLLANLEALEGADAEELIALVEHLDILEGTEPEVSGMFGEIDEGEGR